MSYYTDFNLTAAQYQPDESFSDMPYVDDDIAEQILAELDKKVDVFTGKVPDLSFGVANAATWYDWEKDMLSISSVFPDILFKLDGGGDDTEDKWSAYFLNGKTQFCPVTFVQDKFDSKKLA